MIYPDFEESMKQIGKWYSAQASQRHGCVKKIEGGIAMGQVVVITGCADGMGRHVAKMLATAAIP